MFGFDAEGLMALKTHTLRGAAPPSDNLAVSRPFLPA
jgi:hypothetical protein